MALPKPEDEYSSQYLISDEEAKRYFEEAVQEMLGISGEEFLRRYDAGEYDDWPDTPEGWPILRAIMLIPFARDIEKFR